MDGCETYETYMDPEPIMSQANEATSTHATRHGPPRHSPALTVRTAAAVLVMGLLAACATTPLYQPAESEDAIGYTDTRLTDRQYRVTFQGRRSTSAEAVRDYALLRAAEVTMQQGYDWFEITASESGTEGDERLYTTSRLVTGPGVYHCGAFGCSTVFHAGYIGMPVVTARNDAYHTTLIEFAMGKGEPENPNRVYNASELAQSIRQARFDES